MLAAGELRHRLTILTPSETGGDAVVTAPVVATVWGSLEALGGTEGEALVAQAAYRVRLRYRAGVTPKMRLGLDGRRFEILSVQDPDGRRRELVLMVQEVV
jgi:SPP1 family predicted phage head-tail adaptor